MSEDEYQTAKIEAERLRECLLEMAKRAIAADQPKYMLKPDDLNALCNGRRFLEDGFRDLTRIVDHSNLGKLGHEAIQQSFVARSLSVASRHTLIVKRISSAARNHRAGG